jgi:hypothetical protein
MTNVQRTPARTRRERFASAFVAAGGPIAWPVAIASRAREGKDDRGQPQTVK